MKLNDVLEMLAPFGLHEEEVKFLLGQPGGWKKIQERVSKTYEVICEMLTNGKSSYYNFSERHDKIMELTLKSTQKSEVEQMKEIREVADKFKDVGKDRKSYEDIFKSVYSDNGLEDFFGGILNKK